MPLEPTPLALVPSRASSDGAPPVKYYIEEMREGFWDGQWRARCGFQSLGLFETYQEALALEAAGDAMAALPLYMRVGKLSAEVARVFRLV